MPNRELNVYLNNKKVGVLRETPSSALSFKYIDSSVAPISVRMPVSEIRYGNRYAAPYFENLTPEGTPRKNVALHFGISENNNFSILDKIGGDCAGAISLYSAEPNFEEIPEISHKWSEKEFVNIIKELPKNPLMVGIKNAPRLSLAGAQSKFVVRKDEQGKFWSSNEQNPSTHIIKIANNMFPNLLYNELFCMLLAKRLWPQDSCDVVLKNVLDLKYLEIERYDRQIISGKYVRIHQEDFCQVLGVLSNKKYQDEGGPGIKNVVKAINEFNAEPAKDMLRFLQLIVFNFLIGNADAHAKNLSILNSDNGIKLAPFYDLVSTEIEDENLSKTISMFIKKKNTYDDIVRNDFKNLFISLELNPEMVLRNIRNKFANILQLSNELTNELNTNEVTRSPVYEEITNLIYRRFRVLFD